VKNITADPESGPFPEAGLDKETEALGHVMDHTTKEVRGWIAFVTRTSQNPRLVRYHLFAFLPFPRLLRVFLERSAPPIVQRGEAIIIGLSLPFSCNRSAGSPTNLIE